MNHLLFCYQIRYLFCCHVLLITNISYSLLEFKFTVIFCFDILESEKAYVTSLLETWHLISNFAGWKEVGF